MNRFVPICLTCLLLAGTFTFSACSNTSSAPSNDTTASETITFTNAQELMEACWEADTSAEKPKIIGGMGDEYKEGSPWTVSLSDTSTVSATFVVPVAVLDESESASSMMNAMMANHFTAICLQLKDGADAQSAAKDISAQILSNHWLCGTPEEYKIITKGQFVISCFGLSDSVNPFMDAVAKELGVTAVDYSGPIE